MLLGWHFIAMENIEPRMTENECLKLQVYHERIEKLAANLAALKKDIVIEERNFEFLKNEIAKKYGMTGEVLFSISDGAISCKPGPECSKQP